MAERDTQLLNGKRILLIEDDPILLRAMSEYLAGLGATVAAANEGRSGLEKFKGFAPDLVITDIIMPEKEGIETLMAIKRLRANVAILAISGGGRVGPAEFLKLALSLGADGAMAKPFRNADLAARVAAMLGRVKAE